MSDVKDVLRVTDDQATAHLSGGTVAVVVVDVRLQDAVNHLEQLIRTRRPIAVAITTGVVSIIAGRSDASSR